MKRFKFALLSLLLCAACSDDGGTAGTPDGGIDAADVSFTLTVVSQGGTVSSSPAGIDCGSVCSADFGENSTITLTAVPDSGSQFSDWTGEACAGQGASCTLTLTGDTSVTASYAEINVPVCDDPPGTGDPSFDADATWGFAKVAITEGLGQTTDMAFVPGTGNFIVTVQGGEIHYFDGGCAPKTSLDIEDAGINVVNGGERGLLNLEFHPDWATNKLVFFYHTSTADPTNSITRAELSIEDGDMVIANPVRVIDFLKPSAAGNHNGGGMVFAPDKTLVASVGDSGGQPGPARGQSTNDLLGNVIRIDPVLTGDTAYDYNIPAGNMFNAANAKCYDTDESEEDCPEILALGLRNPYRLSVDGNILYIGDVGSTYEELNSFDFTDNTVNFGWTVHDGPGDENPPYTDPILSYRRDVEAVAFRNDDPECGECSAGSASVMAGSVYRGSRYEGMLDGRLIWGEFYQGYIRALPVDANGAATGAGAHVIHHAGTGFMINGPDDYIYFSSLYDGAIRRLVWVPEP